jgi:cysteinyl-tRNA synthetase
MPGGSFVSALVSTFVSAPLELFNSLGRTKSEFHPLVDGKVSMYSCGPTVYSYQHIGNMRAYVFADTLKRALQWKGYDVTHVVNITDVGHLVADSDTGDDKIELAATRERKTVWELTQFYTDVFFDDLRSLNIQMPNEWTKATAFVPQMITFCEALEASGFTYVLPSGLYFDTAKQADYGALSGLDIEGLREGARVEVVDGKKNPTDFCLWRTHTDDKQHLMEWDSPWGAGSPGWHIECSVMSIETLGKHFDIHTGGVDHRTLHHINEIAQSEAYLGDGQAWVPWWLHNEFLVMRDQKLSKSKGDTLRIETLRESGIHPLAFRWYLLGSHYRSQLEFTLELVLDAQRGLKRIAERFAFALDALSETAPTPETLTFEQAVARVGDGQPRAWIERIDQAISADLHTPGIVSAVAEISRDLPGDADELATLVTVISTLLGIDFRNLRATDLERSDTGDLDTERIDALCVQRDEARAAKDWAEADRLRDELVALGVEVRDSAEGTRWVIAP